MGTPPPFLPPVKGASAKKAPQQSRLANGNGSGNTNNASHRYHKCGCYSHEDNLPNYKLLAIPRTNNYYAATGGCPCIPRVAARPGSWRMKKSQLRSSTHRCGNGCTKNEKSTSGGPCCHHSGDQYGWRPGPHTVLDKNTAATGKCDTFGNLAFKSKSRAYRPIEDDISDVSSASPQKLEDLNALILEEHQQRMRVEADIDELAEIQRNGTAEVYKKEFEEARRRRLLAQLSEAELQELLREVKDVSDRPLNQTNMELLQRILQRQDHLQRQREYYAAQA
ncbi:hypothetical protein ABB37_05931 [Leptomonas pyrrhocoris]|uniref:Uncharacterized protein n=1 Tax=Leptomonas pyrrhocoris TaxID=157538 RepID=A0A0M9FZ26_LEPPY|nr:hypothetical protein ABB37_05931 [Leptomonas pyrrhocoris]XP_015657297.1 hypothetical protein ABB37_05931 [Leptomonas pyrrhocoris]KPA78857.1 hypothetical protein ABB37_05931 [Leptomonas pyrrhocoris]KPA78858.1 hypothetical protein ABB37_05931 [Leptomonas pyrrhocoris]|eukprot:XP_015657296.1 hypothetical protein ABB37_05931 [Leptomonas pyrrhocoris]